MSGPLVLATDLDGTMAHGSDIERRDLVHAVRSAPDATLIYVTGRTPESARTLLTAAGLPAPDVLIADVGTSVLRGAGPERVGEIEAELDATWPGAAAVHARLAAVAGLAPQDVDSPRRVAYWIEAVRALRDAGVPPGADPFAARAPDNASLDRRSHDIATAVARDAVSALEGLDVDVLVSANAFLDVLPRGVNKGTTLRRVLEWLDVDEGSCVVAGDSLNDLALFETGLRGIVVGNCEPALLERIGTMDRIYRASGAGAAGVLEGLRHYGHVDTDTEGDSNGE